MDSRSGPDGNGDVTPPVSRDGGKGRRFKNPYAMPDPEEEPLCGVCGWHPTWLQFFSNMKVFMFCFVGLGVFHGMSHSYFGAVLPSIERRFGFSSAHIGTIKSMNDVSHIAAALIIGHFGGSGHRPRWIATGMFILGLAMFLFASPEFIFPVSSVSIAHSAMNSGGKAGSSRGGPVVEEMCLAGGGNATSPQTCTAEEKNGNVSPLVVFGVAEFLMGLGATTPMILGLPFVDDNVSYRSTPFYFALSFAGRLFGPLLGFGLGAVFNSIYFDFSHPRFQQTDPRWISAWFLGFIVCGIGTCLFAITVGCFPAVLPSRKNIEASMLKEHTKEKVTEKKSTPTHNRHGKPKQQPVVLKDLPRNLKRLMTNSTYMIKLGSQLLEGLAIAGYMGFSQKFIQNQYPVTPSVASLAGGVPPVFSGFLGIAFGSVLIKRFKFQPRHVSIMTVAAALIASACYFSILGMGCDTPIVVGLPNAASTPAVVEAAEEAMERCDIRNHCNCHLKQFSPVCDRLTNISYASPCFAGCASKQWANRTGYYLGCACTANATVLAEDAKFQFLVRGQASKVPSQVVTGLCPSGCTVTNFIQYVIMMCVAKFLMGIPMAGILMIQFRIVDYDLKSLANAFSSVTMSALGFLPAPIVAGYIIDTTCRFWQTSVCGLRGACLLYDVSAFRTKLHVAVGGVKLLAALLDCLVTYKLWNLSFEREPDPGSETMILATEAPTAFQVQDRQPSLAGSENNPGNGPPPSYAVTFSNDHGNGSSSDKPEKWIHLGLSKRTSYPASI